MIDFLQRLKSKKYNIKKMQVQQIDNEDLVGQQSISSRRMGGTRHNTWKLMSRAQKLKDKRITFPESTLSKIVFVSNSQGNGFKKQHLHMQNSPLSATTTTTDIIKVERMIDDINKACFRQWRDSLLSLQKQPLSKYDTFQSMVAICVFVVGAALVGCIIMGLSEYMIKLAYAFMALIFIICFSTFLLIKQKRMEVNSDAKMIKTIKRKLIEFNQLEEFNSTHHHRYFWTCHKDCLWIALHLKL